MYEHPATSSTTFPRGRARVLALAVGAVAALAVLPPATALAQYGFTLRNQASGLCLDSTSRGHVFTGNCKGADEWILNELAGTQLVDTRFNRCLVAAYLHRHRGRVYTTRCRTSSPIRQFWNIWPYGSTPWASLQGNFTHQCLAANSIGTVYMRKCEPPTDKRQQWLLPF